MNFRFTFLCLILLLFARSLMASIELPALLSDRVVLKRDAATRLWGKGAPGTRILCEMQGVRKSALVYPDEQWSTSFDTTVFEDRTFSIIVTDHLGEEKVIKDAVLGEVWFCAGQSNMRRTVGESDFIDEDLPSDRNQELRLFMIKPQAKATFADDVEGEWIICDPQSVSKFSAVAYAFGARLQEELNTPVGLIVAAWGGTAAESWMPIEVLNRSEYQIIHDRFDTALERYPEAKKQYEKNFERWVKLYKSWKRTEEGDRPRKPRPPVYHGHEDAPTNLFNGMVYPVTPMTVSGVLWYQGESNALEGTAPLYESLMHDLIASWRVAFRNEVLPFALVQLPNYPDASQHKNMKSDAWPMVREAQRSISQSDPAVSLAVTLDLTSPSEEDQLHPRNKAPMGQRAAAGILVDYYGKPYTAGYTPQIVTVQKDIQSQWLIEFDGVQGELVLPEDSSELVELIDGDGKKTFAIISASDSNLIVQHPEGRPIVEMYYAYMNNPSKLIKDSSGTPLSPFVFK